MNLKEVKVAIRPLSKFQPIDDVVRITPHGSSMLALQARDMHCTTVYLQLEHNLQRVHYVSMKRLLAIFKAAPAKGNLKLSDLAEGIGMTSGAWGLVLESTPEHHEADNFRSDYPSLDTDYGLTVNAKDFAGLLERTAYAAAKNDNAGMLAAIRFEATTEHLKAVACDGFRLAVSSIRLEPKFAPQKRIVFHLCAASLAKTIALFRSSDTITISYEPDIGVILATDALALRLVDYAAHLEADYPDYESIINKPIRIVADLPVATLKAAIKRVCIFSPESDSSSNELELLLEPIGQDFTIRAANKVGEATEFFPGCKVREVADRGFNRFIYVNSKFLTSTLEKQFKRAKTITLDFAEGAKDFNNQQIQLSSTDSPEDFALVTSLTLE